MFHKENLRSDKRGDSSVDMKYRRINVARVKTEN